MPKITLKLFGQTLVAAIGLISAILGIYAYFDDKVTQLEFEVLSSSNVFDINANVSKLDIIYDSTSLKRVNKNLRVIQIQVKNSGSQDILKDQYDSDDPLGVSIAGGIIIENPEIIQASNSYLKTHVKPKLITKNRLVFSEVIIEESENFTIKLLVLHSNGKVPLVYANGKIAGIKNIPVVDKVSFSKNYDEKDSIFYASFNGNIYVQFIRSITYFLAIVIIILGLAFIDNHLSVIKLKYKRKRFLSNFSEFNKEKVNSVFSLAVTEGPEFINSLNSQFEKDYLSKESINKALERKDELDMNEKNTIISYKFRSAFDKKTPFEVLESVGILGETEKLSYYDVEYKRIIEKFISIIRKMKANEVNVMFHPAL